MSASLYVPISVAAKTREELTKTLLRIQAQAGGKVSVISIYYDPDKKEHICWYYPLRNLGGGVM
jgi:hypothetical protein